MMVPLEIEDEEYEQVLERVAAVDVAKATGMVCTLWGSRTRPSVLTWASTQPARIR